MRHTILTGNLLLESIILLCLATFCAYKQLYEIGPKSNDGIVHSYGRFSNEDFDSTSILLCQSSGKGSLFWRSFQRRRQCLLSLLLAGADLMLFILGLDEGQRLFLELTSCDNVLIISTLVIIYKRKKTNKYNIKDNNSKGWRGQEKIGVYTGSGVNFTKIDLGRFRGY